MRLSLQFGRVTRRGTAALPSAITFLIAMLFSARCLAGIHPVPLDKNIDSAKCLECHEDKTKGKAVHTAIATGCLTCHEVRVNRDVTRVKLITATPTKLCLQCHEDKTAAQIEGHVHAPAVNDCLGCHNPHTSDNKNQLLKATSGASKAENLCLTCHTKGAQVPEKGSRHVALDAGCDTCHVTHKTGEAPSQENNFHLAKSVPALCVECHDTKDESLVKAHRNQPFEKTNCVTCHDPHQSASPKLLQAFVHPPFAEKSCELCHAPAKDGKVVLTQTDVRSLCVTCHAAQAKRIEAAKVPHPGAIGDCTDCHNPHASRTAGLPKTDAVEICLACHADIAEQGKKKVHHQPAFGQGCSTCHEGHGGENEKLLRVKGNALCLECHGSESVPQKVEGQHAFTIFDGKVRLPEDYFEKNRAAVLPLKYNLGHPVARHPVTDVMDANDVRKVKTPLSCLSCHQPHASEQTKLLVKDQENNMAFCDNCHKNRLDMTQMGEVK